MGNIWGAEPPLFASLHVFRRCGGAKITTRKIHAKGGTIHRTDDVRAGRRVQK